MGFRLRCAVARVDDDDLAARMIDRARSLPHVSARRLVEPWRGVVAGFDPDELVDRIHDDPAAFGLAKDDARRESAEIVETLLDPLFAAFPDQRFACIEADCFGGTCMYSGDTVGPGERVYANGSDAHQTLLAAIGVSDPSWYFAPFTRGFFDTGREPDGPKRRPVVCYAAGKLTGMTIGAATISAMTMAVPWKVTIATERSAIIVHGDDLVVSLNVIDDDTIELKASSHVDADTTAGWIDALVDELCVAADLRLVDADSRPLRSWRIG